MKTFVAVCVILAALAYVEANFPPQLLAFREKCKAKTGVDDSVLQRAIKLDIDENDRKLQCYSSCMLQSTNVLKDDGSIAVENFLKFVTPDRMSISGVAAIECSKTVDDSDLCKKAMLFYKCVHNKVGDKSIFA